MVMADISGQREESARVRSDAVDLRHAVDIGGAAGAAQRQFADHAHERPAAGPFGDEAELAAMKVVLRAEAFIDDNGDAEQRAVRAGADLRLGDSQVFAKARETIAAEQVHAVAAAAANVLPDIDVGSIKLTGFMGLKVTRHQAGESDFQ